MSYSPPSPLPADDTARHLRVARPSEDDSLLHFGVAGDNYTILISGKDTAGRYCLIDMLVPPGGGPPPHRHDFEEMFSVLEGELEVTFRGDKVTLRAGETANIPANAPHYFRNVSDKPVRMLCLCSPAGQEEFFAAIGIPLPDRHTHPPKLDEETEKKMKEKAMGLAAQFHTEFIKK